MDNFKKLKANEVREFIDELRDRGASFHFKFESSPVFRVKLQPSTKKNFLSAKKPAHLHPLFHKQTATVIIPFEQERYFFVSPLIIEDDWIHFRMDVDFFHLHRRKVRRLTIPSKYPAFLMIKRIDDSLSFLKGMIVDLSDGGLRASLNSDSPAIHVGNVIVATLRLGSRRGIELRGHVRHNKLTPRSAWKQTFGIEFFDVSPHSKAMLANQILELQRDLFTLFMTEK